MALGPGVMGAGVAESIMLPLVAGERRGPVHRRRTVLALATLDRFGVQRNRVVAYDVAVRVPRWRGQEDAPAFRRRAGNPRHRPVEGDAHPVLSLRIGLPPGLPRAGTVQTVVPHNHRVDPCSCWSRTDEGRADGRTSNK